MDREDAEHLVLSVISKRTGICIGALSYDSRLLQDLKLDGDDAIDALLEIAQRSLLRLDDFDASLYFNSEPNLVSLFRSKKMQKKELTIGQIVRAARDGAQI
jgi:hypothetical protein